MGRRLRRCAGTPGYDALLAGADVYAVAGAVTCMYADAYGPVAKVGIGGTGEEAARRAAGQTANQRPAAEDGFLITEKDRHVEGMA